MLCSFQVSKCQNRFSFLYVNTVVVLSVVRTTPVVKDVSGTARCSSIKCDTAFDTLSPALCHPDLAQF